MDSTRRAALLGRQRAFLAAFAECGNVQLAAAAARIHRRRHYKWLARDPDYRERFSDARETAADLLEAEALRRAVHGVDEPVIYQGKQAQVWVDRRGRRVAEGTRGATKVPLTVKRYSDVLLIFLLKGIRPDVYRENVRVQHTGPKGGPVQVEHRPSSPEKTAKVIEILVNAGAVRLASAG